MKEAEVIKEVIATLKEIKKRTVSNYINYLCDKAIEKLNKLLL